MNHSRKTPTWKSHLAMWLPPSLMFRYRKWKLAFRWDGPYATWDLARANATGYDDPRILERLKESARKVRRGEATYERDGLVFDRTQYSWPVLAGLLKAAADHGNTLSVLDIGGSLGTSYLQNKTFLKDLKRLRWSVVEQPHIAQAGKAEFEDAHLHFYESVASCLRKERPQVALLSSVLSYVQDPYELIQQAQRSGAEWIIVDLTLVQDGPQDLIMVQRVPKNMYEASYPCRHFSFDLLNAALMHTYELIETFEPFTDPVFSYGIPTLRFQGFILRRKRSSAKGKRNARSRKPIR